MSRPISFTLVVDDFGIKYVGEEHLQHLLYAINEPHNGYAIGTTLETWLAKIETYQSFPPWCVPQHRPTKRDESWPREIMFRACMRVLRNIFVAKVNLQDVGT